MLSVLIKYLIAKLETFEYLDRVYGLATTVQVGDETMPAVYSGNELTHINFDSYDSLIYIQQNGKVGRETTEHPAVACKYNVVERYPLRLIVYSQGKENINCESYSQQIADSIKASLNGKQQTLETAANLTNATIILGDTDLDKNSVWQSQFSSPNQLTDKDILISIDLEFEIEGDDTCFANNPCENSEFVFDLDSQTFCERVDDCLNIPEGDGNYMLKILDGVKSWVTASSSAAWGTITGTITDQTDLVNYITTRLTGYATEAFVTSQGYITNVITSLGYTPENVANKTATISGNESSTTLYPNVKGVVDWIKQGMTGLLSSLSLTKTTPVGEDSLLINDSADSDKLKLFSFTNLIAYLRGFFVSNLFVSTADYSTSSTSEVLLKSELIPAGTIGVGKLLTIAPRYIKAGGSGTVQATIRIHTSSVAGAGNQLTGGSFAAGTRHIHYHKIGAVKSTTDTLFGATGIVDDYINSTATPVSYNIDWSVDQYVNFCGLVASASDTLFLSSYKITVE